MRRSFFLGCAAAFGLIAAHVIDYAVAFRDPVHRAAILHATGHGYLSRAIAIGVAAGMVALAGSAALGLRHRVRGSMSWQSAAFRLATIQVGGFVLLEISERIASGARVTGLAGVLGFLGVALQIAVACIVALVLVGVRRAAAVVASALRRAPLIAADRKPRLFAPAFDARVPRLAFASALAARAPPGSPR